MRLIPRSPRSSRRREYGSRRDHRKSKGFGRSMPTDSPLQEFQRKRLDTIVQQMLANNEPDENIRLVVGDFKQKYRQATQEPTGFGERVSAGFGEVGRGVIAGGESTVKGLLQLPGAIAGAPRQVASDIGALFSRPSEAIPEQWQRAKQFAWGAVPFSQSISDVMAGKPLKLGNLAQQGTERGLSLRVPQLVAKAVPAATKALARNLPGASVELNQIASGQLRALPE